MVSWRQWMAGVGILACGLLASFALPRAQAADFLDPEDAFKFSAVIGEGGRTVEAHFDIAEGYYLYRERFAFSASDGAQLGVPRYPPAKAKFDETFSRQVEVYRGNVVVNLPVNADNGPFTLTARFQGCADRGLCYPPEARTARLTLTGTSNEPPAPGARSPDLTSSLPIDASGIDTALKSRSLVMVVPVFFVLGLLLSFTPCVFPMLPILSSIIVGQAGSRRGESNTGPTRSRAFLLALAYASGMIIVYTAFGIAAGLAGEGLAAALQRPWVVASFAALLVALALSMFGFYDLQLPSTWQTYLTRASNRQGGGKLPGVFAMGAIGALIVGPCVAAPLAGALLYISQTRDVVIGGGALFALAAGMSMPLLLVGVSAGWLLPRAGKWMESIRRLFGALLIGVALWTISPLIPPWAQMLSWATLLVVGAAYLRAFDALPGDASGWSRLWKGVGLILLIAGTLELVGAAGDARDPLRPLEPLLASRAEATATPLMWTRITSVEQLDGALAAAADKPVLVEFYADWCVSCKEMERFTLGDPRVAAQLAGFSLLRVDVTANNDRDRSLLRRFGLFGPPATLFFGQAGREVAGTRVIGFQRAEPFLQTLLSIDLSHSRA